MSQQQRTTANQQPLASERTRLGRRPERGSHDANVVAQILDASHVCHVAFALDGRPRLLPTAYCRIDDTLYLHGSPKSGIVRAAERGDDLSVAVTLVDGLVLARSAMHHSLNYRAVVIFGKPRLVDDVAEKSRALNMLVEHVLPGRSRETRGTDARELDATTVVAVPLNEASAKIRTGPPADSKADLKLPHWAGVVPIHTHYGQPLASPDLAADIGIAQCVRAAVAEPLI